jgi:lipoic acid synthetase
MAKPEWLKVRARSTQEAAEVREMLKRLSLHTVCEEAGCPNIMECFGRRTATFMILGRNCTRNCTFCNVTKGELDAVDPAEPVNVAKAVKELGLHHVVVTSVTRDDLEDGGAGHFAETILEIRALNPSTAIEVLIPDFRGNVEALKLVVDAKPQIINHNVETVPRLYSSVRPMAVYQRSLELLKNVKGLDSEMITKSGMMVGLGEEEGEVFEVMKDLRAVGCDVLTIGQYLAPSRLHHPVIEYVHPDVFERYKEMGMELGFKYVASAPLVRSSYRAEEALGTGY